MDDANPLITYGGSRLDADPGGCFDATCHSADASGATTTYRFNGTAITWYGIKGSDQGTATVAIDGVVDGHRQPQPGDPCRRRPGPYQDRTRFRTAHTEDRHEELGVGHRRRIQHHPMT